MLVFPQLSTGASALYPLTKTSRQRTVVNTLGGRKHQCLCGSGRGEPGMGDSRDGIDGSGVGRD
jgi:hypothetical protein